MPISVAEALFHAGTACDAEVTIRWVDSETLTPQNIARTLCGCGGILVPGGFGDRGIEGMILAAQFAREKNIPYLGICLGMQIAVIEFARHAAGWADADSAEFSSTTAAPLSGARSSGVSVLPIAYHFIPVPPMRFFLSPIVAEYEKSTTPRQNFFPQRGIL